MATKATENSVAFVETSEPSEDQSSNGSLSLSRFFLDSVPFDESLTAKNHHETKN